MKTRDLITALQEADPTGEEEVAVGNEDIHFVDVEPAYYDGCLQVLKRDEAKTDCYNIIGGEIRSGGKKIVVHTLSLRWMLLDTPDAPVTFDGEYAEKHNAERVAKWREEAKSAIAEIAQDRRRRAQG
jgi:hypothetical protein